MFTEFGNQLFREIEIKVNWLNLIMLFAFVIFEAIMMVISHLPTVTVIAVSIGGLLVLSLPTWLLIKKPSPANKYIIYTLALIFVLLANYLNAQSSIFLSYFLIGFFIVVNFIVLTLFARQLIRNLDHQEQKVIDFFTGINQLMQLMQDSAEAMTASSQEMASKAEETNAQAAEITASIDYLNTDAKENSEHMNWTKSTLEKLVQQANEKITLTMQTTQMILEIIDATQSGLSDSSNVAESIERINKQLEGMQTIIQDLNVNSETISNITDSIREVVDQIALLSLNAQIEAARAGEHGKGFAVIAQNIARLSDESKQASITIQELISQIVVLIRNTVQQSTTTGRLIQESFTRTANLISNFNQIQNSLVTSQPAITEFQSYITSQIEIINQIAEHVTEANQFALTSEQAMMGINESMQQLETMSEELASNANQLSAQAQSIAGTLEDVNTKRQDIEVA